MNSAPQISALALAFSYALLLLPFFLCYYFKIPVLRNLFISTIRMSGQLFFAGIVLTLLFKWDRPALNIAWVFIMVIFAALSAINNSNLNYRIFIFPVFISLLISSFVLLLFFNTVIVSESGLFEARVFVVVGGMLHGNGLRGIVIGISRFYDALRKEEKRYQFYLSMGASRSEAIIPFFKESLMAALKPNLASMATMGLVFLPGMMTGQILGGSSPETAIKYQIAIMIIIFVAVTLCVSLTVFFSVRKSIDSFGIPEKNIFRHIE